MTARWSGGQQYGRCGKVGYSLMDRKTLIIILVVLVVIAVGLWALRLRTTQYPKEYTGEQPA